MIEHKEYCSIINGKQNVKLEKGFISFKNYLKEIPVPFKIYVDFECILEKVDCDIEHDYTTIYTEEKMLLINLLNQFFMSTTIVGK